MGVTVGSPSGVRAEHLVEVSRVIMAGKKVQIEVISGQNLPNLDFAFDISQLGVVAKASDPYVICSQGGKELFTTEAVKDTENPEWNHKFSGNIDPRKGDLVFTVYDKDTFTADDYIGRCTVPVATTKKNYSLTANEVKKTKKGGDMPSTNKSRRKTSEASTLKIKVVVESELDCFGDCAVQ